MTRTQIEIQVSKIRPKILKAYDEGLILRSEMSRMLINLGRAQEIKNDETRYEIIDEIICELQETPVGCGD